MCAFHVKLTLNGRDRFRSEETKSLIALLSQPDSLLQQLPSHSAAQISKRRDTVAYKKRDYRYGPIRIDWVDFEAMNSSVKKASDDWNTPVAVFEPSQQKSGTTNLPDGIIHIFKESSYESQATHSFGLASSSKAPSSSMGASSSPISYTSETTSYGENHGTIVAVLAIPSWMTPADFLAFVAPAAESMKHLRLVRDVSPNRTMVIIQFKDVNDAVVFTEEFNGRPFNSVEPEVCNIVRVNSVKVEADDPVTLTITRSANNSHSSVMYELPTCPVCLDRMDASVTGLVTVPCSHTFHCTCLSKWGDSRCPVCRYSQIALSSTSISSTGQHIYEPPPSGVTFCSDCDSRINLWICLICGNIGCGRQGRAHAKGHYELSTHLYAMELETQRVWDYAGDNYVHRLIQNKSDGKLVELPSAASSLNGPNSSGAGSGPGDNDDLKAEKMEIMAMQYSQILQRAMDDQRRTYEEQGSELTRRLDDTQKKLEILTLEFDRKFQEAMGLHSRRLKEVEDEKAVAERDREKAERKAEKVTDLARRLESDLKAERAISEGLMKNIDIMKKRAETSEGEKKQLNERITDLEENLRDVMFFLESRDKIEEGGGAASEAAGGDLIVVPPTATPSSRNSKKKKKTK